MIRRPPISTRTDTLFPYTTLFRSHYRSDSRNAYVSFAETGHSNLYNPVRVARPQTPKYVGGDMHSPLLTERIQTTSVAVADTMSFLDDRVLFTAGLRHQKISNRTYNYDTGESNGPANSASRITPVAGLVVKATDQISLYANYIEGMSQVSAAPVTTGFPAQPVVHAATTFDPVQDRKSTRLNSSH